MIGRQYFAFALAFVAVYCVSSALSNGQTNTCYCAAMNFSSIGHKLVEKAVNFTFPCNSKGDKFCNSVCTTLASTAKADPRGRTNFCEYYHKDGRLKVSVYSKACDRQYIPTGIASDKFLCCKNQKAVECDETDSKINFTSPK